MKFEGLTKTVAVTDPDNWYGQDTVTVSLFITPPFRGRVAIRILIRSIDDFAVLYDIEKYENNKDGIKWAYNHLKEWLYDRMPDKISLDWLYEHGYLPF